jgi:hypothetical protein
LNTISDEFLGRLQRLWQQCDTDQSGRLEPNELKERLAKLGLDASDEKVEELMQKMGIQNDCSDNDNVTDYWITEKILMEMELSISLSLYSQYPRFCLVQEVQDLAVDHSAHVQLDHKAPLLLDLD